MSKEDFFEDLDKLQTEFTGLNIIKKIGEGGQKHVYLVENAEERMLALKLIKLSQKDDRILREIKAATCFGPPRFPQIFEYGEKNLFGENVIYILEEYIQGVNLKTYLQNNTISEQKAIEIGLELLKGLEEISKERLVHRDIKPENIMIEQAGRVVILDFGIARHLSLTSLTQDLAAFGPMTPGYAAPEQIKNQKRSISSRTDIFSWGIVMYEMLSGYNPFIQGCSSVGQVLSRTLSYEPEILKNCDKELAEIIKWSLNKVVHRRPVKPEVLIQKIQGGSKK